MMKTNCVMCAGIITLLLILMVPMVSADSTVQPGYITVGLAPVANFNAVYTGTTAPAVVTFQDQSTGQYPINILLEFWRWRNINRSKSTTHVYSEWIIYRQSHSNKCIWGQDPRQK